MVIFLITNFVFLSALFCIRAKYNNLHKQLIVFKPLTLILIIFIAFLSPTIEVQYKIFIIAGLLFSLVGDTFLIYPKAHFKKGLIAFLIGHICYIFAFLMSSRIQFTPWVIFIIAIFGIAYLRLIIPHTAKLKIPVIIYVLVILIMGWLAIERHFNLQNSGSTLAATAAVLFMISDGVLAWNKFKKPFFYAEIIILSTYFLAQWLFAISVNVI